MTKRLSIFLFVLLCAAGALCDAAQVRRWGNDLSYVDAYSEANNLREARNFLEQGLWKYHGLGNVYHDGMYPDEGFATESDDKKYALTPEGVYTHYPPGPEYLIYAAARLIGAEPVWRIRLLPIALGGAAMIFLGLSVRRRFGATVGWLVMGACAATPCVTDVFTCLHYQGYAFALLLFELGILLSTGTARWPFAVLGFLQGWLSFDYVFLIAALPLAIELVMPRIDPVYRRRWPLAMTRAALIGAAFAAAHLLHFFQVWAYWGTFAQALADFGASAAHRVGAERYSGALGYLAHVDLILYAYFIGMFPFSTLLHLPDADLPEGWMMFRIFGLSLGPWWLLATAAVGIWDARLPSGPNKRALIGDWLFVTLCGIATSSLWLIAMIDHAVHHRHFLYRHLFFAFFVSVLFCAVAIGRRLSQPNGETDTSRERHDASLAAPS